MDVRRRADVNEDRALAVARRIDRTAAVIEAGLVRHHPARVLFGLAVGIERRIPAGGPRHIARRMDEEDVDLWVLRRRFDAGGNVGGETRFRRKRGPGTRIGIIGRRRLRTGIPNVPRPEETEDDPHIAREIHPGAGYRDQNDDRRQSRQWCKEKFSSSAPAVHYFGSRFRRELTNCSNSDSPQTSDARNRNRLSSAIDLSAEPNQINLAK